MAGNISLFVKLKNTELDTEKYNILKRVLFSLDAHNFEHEVP